MYGRAIKMQMEDSPSELREAAAVLGLTRGAFFDLLAARRVSPVQMSAEKMEHDFRRG